MKARQRKMFYGWWIVLGSFFGIQLGFTALFYTFSVFLKPIADWFLWNRGEVSFSISIGSLGAIVGAPVFGRLMDRYGVRPVVLVSTLFFTAGLVSFRYLPMRIWYLYLLFFCLGLLAGGTTLLPYTTLVSRWFDKRRGIALGVMASGSGTGGLLLPPAFHSLIVHLGWTNAYAVLGALSCLVVIPIALLVLKERPQDLGLPPDGWSSGHGGKEAREKTIDGMSWKEARRTPTFWCLAASFFLMSSSINGPLIHLVSFLTDRGMAASTAALYVSLLAGASLFGRIVSGYMADRWIAKYVAMMFFAGASAGTFVLWLRPEDQFLAAAVFVLGLAFGAEVDLSAYLVGKCFGLSSFGEIYSYIYGIFVLGAVAGPAFAGVVFDRTNSYEGAFLTFLVAMLFSTASMLPVRSLSETRASEAERLPVA
jgi:MFS family permease